MSRRGRGWALAVPLTVAAAGLLFTVTAVTASGHDLRDDRRDNVTDLITERQQTIAAEQTQLARLKATLAAAASGDPRGAAARSSADALAPAAGTRPVTGPAVTVSLDDAPHPSPSQTLPGNPAPDDLVVHQQDVQAVVNALWAGGAEAMTIMGQRVLSTTAVRCVGNTLLLRGRVYSPPFVVTAIGDPARLNAALDASRDVTIYKQYVAAYRLGWSVTTHDTVTLPGLTAVPELAYATPGPAPKDRS